MQTSAKQVKLGGFRIGLVGLEEVLQEVSERCIADEDELKHALVEGIKSMNYVPRSSEEEYGDALLKEYKKSLGLEVEEEQDGLQIKVLGPGCPECRRLQCKVMEVLSEIKAVADLEHVSDANEIGSYGVFGTPALIINGKLRSSGRVLPREHIKRLIEEARSKQSMVKEAGTVNP